MNTPALPAATLPGPGAAAGAPVRVLPGDPRLAGVPQGGVYRYAKQWHVRIYTDRKGVKAKVVDEWISANDYENDMEAAKRVADALLQERSDHHNLTRNKCTVMENGTISMDIGKGYTMLFNAEYLDLIRPYIWHARESDGSDLVYAFAYIGGKSVGCHRFILNVWDPNQFVDHKNGTTLRGTKILDNRLSNLRLASTFTNALNHRTSKRSKTGVNAVAATKSRKGQTRAYVASWPENGKRRSKAFPISDSLSSAEAFASATKYRHGKEAILQLDTRRVAIGEILDAYTEAAIEFVRDVDARCARQQAVLIRLFTEKVPAPEAARQCGVVPHLVYQFYGKLRAQQDPDHLSKRQREETEALEDVSDRPEKKQRTLDAFIQ